MDKKKVISLQGKIFEVRANILGTLILLENVIRSICTD